MSNAMQQRALLCHYAAQDSDMMILPTRLQQRCTAGMNGWHGLLVGNARTQQHYCEYHTQQIVYDNCTATKMMPAGRMVGMALLIQQCTRNGALLWYCNAQQIST
jgi:hypothetical protein